MADVVLRLLGPLTVVGRQAPLNPPPGRVTTVLALLALEVGRVVSLDRLMDQLWGDSPPRSGPATLHVYVSRLRRLLQATEARIVTRPPGYLLDLPRESVDAHLLAARVAAAEQAAAHRDWVSTLDLIRQARQLRVGTPFVDAYACPDLITEADRLERLARRAEELAARSLLALERPGEAHAVAVELTEADRLNETYWRLRVRAAHQLGNNAAALAAYGEFRELLADELGLDPTARMQQLHLEVLRAGSSAGAVATNRPAPAEPPPHPEHAAPAERVVSAPPGITPTARQAERADLLACVEGTVAGFGRTVILEGEPGIGKSFLAGWAATAAQQRGVRLVWARAIEGLGTPPLWMWEQVLGALAGDGPVVGQSGAELVRTLAEGGPAGGSEPERARFRLFERIVSQVAEASRQQPLLLVFDDVQWADDSTLHTLRLLGHAVAGLACSAVVTARTGPARSPVLDTTLAAMAREDSSSRWRLEPFSRREIEQYLNDTASGRGVEDASCGSDVDQLHLRSGGNPFFLGELIRAENGQGWNPTTVAGLVSSRSARLPEPTRRVLEHAAVAGSSFDALVVARSLGLSLIDMVTVLDPAVDEGFVLADWESRSWRFAHDLGREAIVGALSPRRRAELHGRLADAIHEVHADDPDDHVEEIADHRFRAVGGAPSAAAHAACRAAADRAVQRLAYDQAALHRSRALATLELGPAHRRERLTVLLQLTAERRLAGDVVGAAASLGQAIDLARLIGDRALLTRAVTVLGGVTLWNWRQFEQVDRETIALLEELVRSEDGSPGEPAGAAESGQPVEAVSVDRQLAATRHRSELLGTLAVELYYDDARARGEELALEAVSLARRVGDPALLGRALNNFVIAAWVPGKDGARLAALDESLALAGAGLPLPTEVIARLHRSSLALRAGDVPAFEEDLDQAGWLAPRLGIPELEGQVDTTRAGLALLRGDTDAVRELIERAHRQLKRTSLWGADWTRLVQLTTLARLEGRTADLVDPLVAKASEDVHRTLRWTAVLAVAEAGDERQARNLQARWGLRTIPRRPHWGSSFEWAQAAETSLLLGSPAPAEVYRALTAVADELVVAGTGVAVWGPVADVLARLADRLGDSRARDQHGAAADALTRRVTAGLGLVPWWPTKR